MVELKWNFQFYFNSGQFHFAIPIPWLEIPIPEFELKSIPIPMGGMPWCRSALCATSGRRGTNQHAGTFASK